MNTHNGVTSRRKGLIYGESIPSTNLLNFLVTSTWINFTVYLGTRYKHDHCYGNIGLQWVDRVCLSQVSDRYNLAPGWELILVALIKSDLAHIDIVRHVGIISSFWVGPAPLWSWVWNLNDSGRDSPVMSDNSVDVGYCSFSHKVNRNWITQVVVSLSSCCSS